MTNKDEIRKILGISSQSSGKEQRAAEIRSIINGTNNNELSFPEKTLQVPRGAAKMYGSMMDLGINNPINPMAEMATNYQMPEQITANNPTQFSEFLPTQIDKLAGRSLEPHEDDTWGHVREGTGEFLAPLFPGSGLVSVAKHGAKAIPKASAQYLAREAPLAVGASTLMHATPEFTEEGSGSRVVEDLAKGIAGAALGHKSASLGMGAYNLAKNANYSEIPKSIVTAPRKALAKVASLGSNPNIEAMELAKKHGVNLPHNVGMNSPIQNSLANNYLKKSMFTSGNYKKILNEADESMINKINQSINSLGDSSLKPSEASAQYSKFIKEEKNRAKQEASKYYDAANSHLTNKDKVVPKNTIKSFIGMKEFLSRDIKSNDTNAVAKKIGELAEKWGLVPNKNSISHLKESGYSADALSDILGSFAKTAKPIEVDRLVGVKKELGNILKHDKDIEGAKGYLKRIKNSIEEDIRSSKNKNFVEGLHKADTFFKKGVGDRFRNDIARSLTRGDAPIEAYSMMTSPKKIRIIKKISGESENGKEIFNAMAKARVREIIESATTAGGLEKGSLQTAQFAKMFSKGEKRQEMLKELLGTKEYNNMSEVAKISQEFSKSGQDLLNTSGTAMASADLNRMEKITHGAIGLMTGASVAGAKGAVASVAITNLASRLLANRTFTNEMRAYAIARKQGKEKYARTLLNRLEKRATDIQKGIDYAARHELINKRENED